MIAKFKKNKRKSLNWFIKKLKKVKEKIKSQIEEWLEEKEEELDFEKNSIAPTGIARDNWIRNNMY